MMVMEFQFRVALIASVALQKLPHNYYSVASASSVAAPLDHDWLHHE